MRLSHLIASIVVMAGMIAPLAVLAADAEGLPSGEGPGGQVAQQCLTDLRMFDDELARSGFGVLAPGGYGVEGYTAYAEIGTPRRRMQALRDAAYAYALHGNEQSCQMVLASMQQVYQEHRGLIGPDSDYPDARTAWRRAHLAQASPVTGMDRLMRADVIIGADIRTPEDERLGEIADIVLDPERQAVAYVLATRGGFLGFGKELVAVRWIDLRATPDHEIYVFDASPEAFAAAPKVERESFQESSSEAWRGTLDRYWEGVVGK